MGPGGLFRGFRVAPFDGLGGGGVFPARRPRPARPPVGGGPQAGGGVGGGSVDGLAGGSYGKRSGAGGRPHSPDVCDALNIRTVGLVDLFREQGL